VASKHVFDLAAFFDPPCGVSLLDRRFWQIALVALAAQYTFTAEYIKRIRNMLDV
jgi:hypothetical protein